MDIIRLNPECITCLLNKQLGRYSQNISLNKKIEYMQKILKITADAPLTMSAPELMEEFYKIQKDMFDIDDDYTYVKQYFNKLMMSFEPMLQNNIINSKEPLMLALQYVMTGNYIDFGAMDKVDEDILNEMLDKATEIDIDRKEFNLLSDDIIKSKKMVYLIDNCGEIVLDKLLISLIKKINSKLDVTAIVRGKPVLNDATIDDALQCGLTDMVKVVDNGTAIAGTCLNKISDDSLSEIENADFIISKGQGNFETLNRCGKNIYYIFMCKCKMFADRFNVPVYSGMLINDSSVSEFYKNKC